MRSFLNAFVVEYLKMRKSTIFYSTLAVFVFIPIMLSLLMLLAKHPDIAAKLGLIGAKSGIFATTDWIGYFGVLTQTIASVGLIGFGFVCSYVFGREYIDRTLNDILAMPLSRTYIVMAKFAIVIIWCCILSIVLFASGMLSGIGVGLHFSDFNGFMNLVSRFLMTTFLTLFLISPVAFFASYGKGIVAPLGFVIFTLILAQFIALMGIGPYFPWSIPGVYTVSSDAYGMHLTTASYIILSATFVVGLLATIAWWRRADHH